MTWAKDGTWTQQERASLNGRDDLKAAKQLTDAGAAWGPSAGEVVKALAQFNGMIGAIERFALTDVGLQVRQQRQAGVVGVAQRCGVDDAVQMTDRRPHAGQFVMHGLHRLCDAGKRWIALRLDQCNLAALPVNDGAQRRFGVLGAQDVKRRQVKVAQQRIGQVELIFHGAF